jgi:hypothetical protein
MYRAGRPNWVAAVLNRCWAVVGTLGLGRNRLVTLQVRGRRTGRIVSFPVVVADLEGERSLVAMLGEHAAWVANVRASGGRVVLRHGRREPVGLEEVDSGDRPPILRRYLQVAPRGPTTYPGRPARAHRRLRARRRPVPGLPRPRRHGQLAIMALVTVSFVPCVRRASVHTGVRANRMEVDWCPDRT